MRGDSRQINLRKLEDPPLSESERSWPQMTQACVDFSGSDEPDMRGLYWVFVWTLLGTRKNAVCFRIKPLVILSRGFYWGHLTSIKI